MPANLASGETQRPDHDPSFGPAKLRRVVPFCAAERDAPVVSFGNHHLGPDSPAILCQTYPVSKPLALGGLGNCSFREKPMHGESPAGD